MARLPILSAFTTRRAARYLPAASLAAALTGIAALFLPSAARSLFPFLSSTFLIFLPNLWNALLGKITPPCLFVLLNGIIMILTLSSGVLKTSCAGGSDFCSNSPVMTEPKLKSVNVRSPVKRQQFPKVSAKRQSSDKLHEDLSLLLTPENPATVTRSSSLAEVAGSGTVTPELRRIRRSNSVDSPASSVDRESCVKDNLASTSSMIVIEVPYLDSLSDEALKKKIDDFISKMNAQIRSESAN